MPNSTAATPNPDARPFSLAGSFLSPAFGPSARIIRVLLRLSGQFRSFSGTYECLLRGSPFSRRRYPRVVFLPRAFASLHSNGRFLSTESGQVALFSPSTFSLLPDIGGGSLGFAFEGCSRTRDDRFIPLIPFACYTIEESSPEFLLDDHFSPIYNPRVCSMSDRAYGCVWKN